MRTRSHGLTLIILISVISGSQAWWFGQDNSSWLKNLRAQVEENLEKIDRLEKDLTLLDKIDVIDRPHISNALNEARIALTSWKYKVDYLKASGKIDQARSHISYAFDLVRQSGNVIEKALLRKIRKGSKSKSKEEIAQIKEDHRIRILSYESKLKTLEDNNEAQKVKLQIDIAQIKKDHRAEVGKIRTESEGKIKTLQAKYDHSKMKFEAKIAQIKENHRNSLENELEEPRTASDIILAVLVSVAVILLCFAGFSDVKECRWLKSVPVQLDEYLAKIAKLETYLTILGTSDQLLDASTKLNEAKLLLTSYKNQLGPYFVLGLRAAGSVAQVRSEFFNAQKTIKECTEIIEKALLEQIQSRNVGSMEVAQNKEEQNAQDLNMTECLQKVLEEKDQADEEIAELRKELGMVHMEYEKLKKTVRN